MEKNPNNPLHSCPSYETNDNILAQRPIQQPPPPPPLPQNLIGPSGSNQVYFSNGIPPPPNSSSSNNSVRKPRGRKPKSQDKNILPPPENTGLSAPLAQRSLLLQPPLPHPMQQRERAQAQLVSPTQQNKQPQPQLSHPMQHTQWPRAQLIPPLQQNQGRQAQFPQPTEQSQWAQAHHQHSPPQMMKRVSYYSKLVAEVMHYQWERPQNNTIEFWREFVAKYYDSKAKEMWCLSTCQDPSTPTRKDGRLCDHCGYRPQRGYEVGFEVLPEIFKAKFEKSRGERLNTGIAQVYKSGQGLTILLYTQATHRSIYDLETVIYKGPLRIVITDQGKILDWQFCVCYREAFVSIKQFPYSENWSGKGGVIGKLEAENVSNESSEENLRRNNNTVQDVQPQIDNNIFQKGNNLEFAANGQRQRIKHNTMNSITRPIQILPSPSSHGSVVIGGWISDQVSGKPVSAGGGGGVNHIRSAAGSPLVDSTETNAAANLHTPHRAEKQLLNDNNKCMARATHASGDQSGDSETGLFPNRVGHDAEDDLERYLIDNPVGQFLAKEMQLIKHPQR